MSKSPAITAEQVRTSFENNEEGAMDLLRIFLKQNVRRTLFGKEPYLPEGLIEPCRGIFYAALGKENFASCNLMLESGFPFFLNKELAQNLDSGRLNCRQRLFIIDNVAFPRDMKEKIVWTAGGEEMAYLDKSHLTRFVEDEKKLILKDALLEKDEVTARRLVEMGVRFEDFRIFSKEERNQKSIRRYLGEEPKELYLSLLRENLRENMFMAPADPTQSPDRTSPWDFSDGAGAAAADDVEDNTSPLPNPLVRSTETSNLAPYSEQQL